MQMCSEHKMVLGLEKGEHVNQEFFERVKGLMKESAVVRNRKSLVTLCIRNLDALISTEEITEAELVLPYDRFALLPVVDIFHTS